MSTIEEKRAHLILIEKVAQYFDERLQPRFDLDLKFVILKESEDAELKILFMEVFHPFDYHPQAVLFHMQKNDLQSVITNGGGKVVFDAENKTIIFSGYSKSFGNFCPKDVMAITGKVWPAFKNVFTAMRGSADVIAVSGKTRSLEEIKIMIERI